MIKFFLREQWLCKSSAHYGGNHGDFDCMSNLNLAFTHVILHLVFLVLLHCVIH